MAAGLAPCASPPITTAVTDALYEKLLIVTETDADGNVVERERRTTVNHAMKTCRRAWNVAARRNPGKVPPVNPFAQMGLTVIRPRDADGDVRRAAGVPRQGDRDGLAVARHRGADRVGMAAARARHLRARFDVTHYRPKERPNAVRVLHEKTGEENWVPLFDDDGVPLYPELMAELDAIKRERIGGLMLRRDWGERATVADLADTDELDLTHMSRKVKEIIRAAGLRDELTFTSFRHGGFTEAADADLTDAEMRAQGRHKSAKVLPTLRQAHHEAGRGRGEEAARDANSGEGRMIKKDKVNVWISPEAPGWLRDLIQQSPNINHVSREEVENTVKEGKAYVTSGDLPSLKRTNGGHLSE